MLSRGKIALLLLSIVILATLFVSQRLLHYIGHKPLTLPTELYQIPPGSSVQALCRQWQQQQLLSAMDCRLLMFYLKQQPELGKLQQGYYRVKPQTQLSELLQLFSSGKVAQFSLTLIEGETLEQSLYRVRQAEYLRQDLPDNDGLMPLFRWPADWGDLPELPEAMLFPDTYFYTAGSSATTLLQRAQQALVAQLNNAWQQRQPDLPLQHPYQLLILASIIEKESGYAPEKPLISSVFINRLRSNMRLQTDPTVIYGLDDFNGRITRADLRNPHPYNTYRHHGLPPGPIALVSQSALLAAAQPAQTELYYFVSKGDGSHVFSETLEQHNAAVRQYILRQNNE